MEASAFTRALALVRPDPKRWRARHRRDGAPAVPMAQTVNAMSPADKRGRPLQQHESWAALPSAYPVTLCTRARPLRPVATARHRVKIGLAQIGSILNSWRSAYGSRPDRRDIRGRKNRLWVRRGRPPDPLLLTLADIPVSYAVAGGVAPASGNPVPPSGSPAERNREG